MTYQDGQIAVWRRVTSAAYVLGGDVPELAAKAFAEFVSLTGKQLNVEQGFGQSCDQLLKVLVAANANKHLLNIPNNTHASTDTLAQRCAAAPIGFGAKAAAEGIEVQLNESVHMHVRMDTSGAGRLLVNFTFGESDLGRGVVRILCHKYNIRHTTIEYDGSLYFMANRAARDVFSRGAARNLGDRLTCVAAQKDSSGNDTEVWRVTARDGEGMDLYRDQGAASALGIPLLRGDHSKVFHTDPTVFAAVGNLLLALRPGRQQGSRELRDYVVAFELRV